MLDPAGLVDGAHLDLGTFIKSSMRSRSDGSYLRPETSMTSTLRWSPATLRLRVPTRRSTRDSRTPSRSRTQAGAHSRPAGGAIVETAPSRVRVRVRPGFPVATAPGTATNRTGRGRIDRQRRRELEWQDLARFLFGGRQAGLRVRWPATSRSQTRPGNTAISSALHLANGPRSAADSPTPK